MLGPVVDVELVDPPDKAPHGVVFGIKHLLTVPNSPDVREALEEDAYSHRHHIVKMTEKNGKHEMEIIDSVVSVTSQYFVTKKLEGKPLCKITSAWLPWGGSTHECTHSSLKNVIVTKSAGKCPHEMNMLYAWCVCEGSKKQFDEEVKDRLHERTPALMKVDIEKSQEHVYDIKLRLSDREGAAWEPPHQISHVEMCRLNGVKLLDGGTLKGGFGCSCSDEETLHCMHGRLIFFELEEHHRGQQVLKGSHDALLFCNGNETPLPLSPLKVESKHLKV